MNCVEYYLYLQIVLCRQVNIYYKNNINCYHYEIEKFVFVCFCSRSGIGRL